MGSSHARSLRAKRILGCREGETSSRGQASTGTPSELGGVFRRDLLRDWSSIAMGLIVIREAGLAEPLRECGFAVWPRYHESSWGRASV